MRKVGKVIWLNSKPFLEKKHAAIKKAKKQSSHPKLLQVAIRTSYALGIHEKECGNHINALKYFRDLVTLDKCNWQSYLQLGLIYSKLNNVEEVCSCLIKAEECSVNASPFHLGQLLSKEEWRDLLNFLEGYTLKPNLPANFLLGLSIAALYNRKLNPLHELISLSPEHFDAYIKRFSPKASLIYQVLARAKHDMTEYKDAIEAYTKSIEYNPLCPRSYYLRSNSYRVISELTKAEEDCRTAIALAPKSIGALCSTGLLQFEQKHYEHAIRCYSISNDLDKQYQKICGKKYPFPDFGIMKCNSSITREKMLAYNALV